MGWVALSKGEVLVAPVEASKAAVSCASTTAVRSETNVRVVDTTPILVPPKKLAHAARLKEVTHVRADGVQAVVFTSSCCACASP